jgi:hypothetical protein
LWKTNPIQTKGRKRMQTQVFSVGIMLFYIPNGVFFPFEKLLTWLLLWKKGVYIEGSIEDIFKENSKNNL